MKTILLLLTLLTSFNGISQWKKIDYIENWWKKSDSQMKDKNGNLLHNVYMTAIEGDQLDSVFFKYGYNTRYVWCLQNYDTKEWYLRGEDLMEKGKLKIRREFGGGGYDGWVSEEFYDDNRKNIAYKSWYNFNQKVLMTEKTISPNSRNSSATTYYGNGKIARTTKVVNLSTFEKCFDMNGKNMNCNDQCIDIYTGNLKKCD